MKKWKVTFTIDGKRSEQVISAYTLDDAHDMIKKQYSGCHISFISTGHERDYQ